MKRAIPILIVLILVLSGLGAGAVSKGNNNSEIEKTFVFSRPVIKAQEEYLTLNIEDTERALRVPGKPEMPMYTYSFDLPFGVKNIEISYETSAEYEMGIFGKIMPSPQPVTTENKFSSEETTKIEDASVYSSTERYPAEWYDYKISSGINTDKTRVTHISLYLFPVQYSPAKDKIYCINEGTIRVTYDKPTRTTSFSDEYDLVIIAPEEFSSDLDALVQHKNDNNVPTFLKTTEEIYAEYSGVDQPEQIKYFIKDAIETNGVDYVLLVGGLKSYYNADDRDDTNQGSTDWYVPVRYTNIEMDDTADPGCISDLYYADIYEGEGNFSSWDSNEDGIFANIGKYLMEGEDELDLNPDVFLGRLPCRSKLEVKIVVQKIIQYESTPPSRKRWYDTMVGIAGMSHSMHQGQPDAEYLGDIAFDYMSSIINNEVRVYSSNEENGGLIPVPKDIIKAFNRGAGYVLFEGHGHPIRWDTHPVGDTSVWMGGLHMRDMWKFFNFRKLPFVVVGGCHNGQFNISWYKTKNSMDFDDLYWTHGDPGAESFCWRMITIPYGGAIASVGATGLTVSWSGQPMSLNSKLELYIFYMLGEGGATTPAEAVAGSIQRFIDEEDIETTESHSITIVHLFGDPTLKLGGFE